MSERLETARALVVQKRYAEARALLKTLGDDPLARRWLESLDRIAPESAPKRPLLDSVRLRYLVALIFVVIMLIAQAQQAASTVQPAPLTPQPAEMFAPPGQ